MPAPRKTLRLDMLSQVGIDSIIVLLFTLVFLILVFGHAVTGTSMSRNREHSHLLLCFFLDLCHYPISSILLYPSLCLSGLVEHHLAHVGFHYRYGLHMPDFLRCQQIHNINWSCIIFSRCQQAQTWGVLQPSKSDEQLGQVPADDDESEVRGA